jgi:hypothetical protein
MAVTLLGLLLLARKRFDELYMVLDGVHVSELGTGV